MNPSDYTPRPTEVAAWIARLTVDISGIAGGEFSTTTVPTDDEVTALIVNVTAEVVAMAGGTIPDGLGAYARSTIALGAAAIVATSYYDNANALGTTLRTWYEAQLKRFLDVAGTGEVVHEPNLQWSMPRAVLSLDEAEWFRLRVGPDFPLRDPYA